MKAFIRYCNTRIHGRTGQQRPTGEEIAAAPRWRTFEELLREALSSLGYRIVEQASHPHQGDNCTDADLRLYAHAGRRQFPAGDWFYKEMHLPGLFTLDPQGWGVEHSMINALVRDATLTEAELDAAMSALRRRYFSAGQSRLPQPRDSAPPELPQGYLLVPLQVADDYVIVHHSPLTVAEFVHLMADWAQRHRRAIVFKRHPGNRPGDEVAQALAQRLTPGSYCHLTSGNIHSLIKSARGVVVLNSGTGLEALIHGRPVVTLARCDYAAATIASAPDDLERALHAIDEHGPMQRMAAWRWLHSYHQRHAFSVHPDCLADTRRRVLARLSQSPDRHFDSGTPTVPTPPSAATILEPL